MKNTSWPATFSIPSIEHNGSATSATPIYAITGEGRARSASSRTFEREKKIGHKLIKKPGIVPVGPGIYSEAQSAPAIRQTNNWKLTGIVTGSPHKAEEWRHQNFSPKAHRYTDQNFERKKNNRYISILCIVLLHAIRETRLHDVKILLTIFYAAASGKHVELKNL